MKTAILAILLFCIMIFPHELGHFIAAKKTGVKVNEFAFGMGPTIWKKQGRETLYSIRLFPIGGFCAMEGEDEESDEPGAFTNKKPWQKIVILAAGSFMNVVCAVVVMSLVLGIMGFTTTAVDNVQAGSPAFEAGMLSGDVIKSIDGADIEEWSDVPNAIAASKGKDLDVIVDRDGIEKKLNLTPIAGEDGRYVMGITSKISHNPFTAVKEGAKATWNMTITMFDTLKQLFTGKVGTENLSGPVGVVQMVSETSEYGFWYYGFLTALICLNLAIINMLPLPALDGGRIIFVIYTMITGKKVSQKVEGTIHLIGMALLFALMIYVTFNDVTRIFGR
ncbi:MAG: RIP metalloprotease RseP [Firmicutes bacterium]|nr:RIP metalloprotease RseP [Bacillota bacterium]